MDTIRGRATRLRRSASSGCSSTPPSTTPPTWQSSSEAVDWSPLPSYFIASSHNTYIVGNQPTGRSDAAMFVVCCLEGCRCLEIDLWDGADGEPEVTHGGTLVTRIRLQAVMEAIAESAFVVSRLPVILSLEMHCTSSQQVRCAEIIRAALGGALITQAEGEGIDVGRVPLSRLIERVIVKGKNQPHSAAQPGRHDVVGMAEGGGPVPTASGRECSAVWQGQSTDASLRDASFVSDAAVPTTLSELQAATNARRRRGGSGGGAEGRGSRGGGEEEPGSADDAGGAAAGLGRGSGAVSPPAITGPGGQRMRRLCSVWFVERVTAPSEESHRVFWRRARPLAAAQG